MSTNIVMTESEVILINFDGGGYGIIMYSRFYFIF